MPANTRDGGDGFMDQNKFYLTTVGSRRASDPWCPFGIYWSRHRCLVETDRQTGPAKVVSGRPFTPTEALVHWVSSDTYPSPDPAGRPKTLSESPG